MSNAAAVESTADNTIDFVDQMFFLSQRALGQGPVIQFLWEYDRGLDLDALARFQANLGHSLLARCVEKSPLPGGRHRWISWRPPSVLDVAEQVRPRSEVIEWADEQCERRIDPEHGPPWRLSAQPLDDGGAAVSLVVSHTVADGVGVSQAVAGAVTGARSDLSYPPARARTRRRALAQDIRAFFRDLPATARALGAIRRAAPDSGRWMHARGGPGDGDLGEVVLMRSVIARVDTSHWDDRAASLGGTSNSLFLGVAARMVALLEWTAGSGPVTLAVPVNERTPGDTRGNAISAVNIAVDPDQVTTDLTGVRSALKTALAGLSDDPNALFGPLPLIPLIPEVLSRRAEVVTLKSAIVNTSNLGDLDPAINRPDGTDAGTFCIRSRWSELNGRLQPLKRCGGLIFPVVSGRLHGSLFFSLGLATADRSITAERLRGVVRTALDQFGLTADLE